MTTLLENPLPVAAVGGLIALCALIVFWSRRDSASLAALAGAVLLTLGLLLVERLVVTERERVENAVAGMIAAVKANDMPGVLGSIDPAAAKVRADVERLMPEIKVNAANSAGRTEVTIDAATEPPTADARILAVLVGIHERSGAPVGYYKQRVDLHWVKRGERWLLDDYTAYFNGQPIDAAGSAAGNRPVPKR
jgi:hypothetical protein